MQKCLAFSASEGLRLGENQREMLTADRNVGGIKVWTSILFRRGKFVTYKNWMRSLIVNKLSITRMSFVWAKNIKVLNKDKNVN